MCIGELIAGLKEDYLWRRAVRMKAKYGNVEYVERAYRRALGRIPDLDDPVRFTEKMQWMKLYYNNPLLVVCADKYGVRSYVEKKGCGDILIPIIGVYDDPERIDVASLPDRFVVKATHGSAWNLIVKDKTEFLRKKKAYYKTFRKWLSRDYSLYGRELHYTYIPPRIIIEEFLEEPDGGEISDYKIFCFGGKPELIQVDYDRHSAHTRNYFDTGWKLMDMNVTIHKNKLPAEPAPGNLKEMLDIARVLSEDFIHVRVDLYSVAGKIYFGELTFTDGNGMFAYDPDQADFMLGGWLGLPGKDDPYVIKR